MDNYLQELNQSQRDAVENINGPCLIIAGAGSGKTRVLTSRIAHLLENDVQPENILSLTFTNKAAKEMKERIASVVGYEKAKYLWMGTFHSIFSRILRKHADKLGFKQSFTIYDTNDSKNLIKAIVKENKLDDQIYKPAVVYNRISSAKNALITPVRYFNDPIINARDQENRMPDLGKIYKIYVTRCKQSSAMDFDDLLLYTNILFRDFSDIIEYYQNIFKYILVDEYQDTNFAQYTIVKKLAAKYKNVSVVGDDSQSIYAFRGAKIENIFNFKKDYPNYSLFKLEKNYRSTQTIVNASNSLIEKNKNRIPKVIFSENEEGEKIKVIEAYTDNEESYLVVNDIFDDKFNYQLDYKDFAILYRTNAQSRVFEEALRKRNIPYKIYGGLSFYQRKEIKNLMAYLRVTINPDDEEALKRIINYPTRGIGQTTLAKINAIAASENIGLWQIINSLNKYSIEINSGTKNKLTKFANLINTFNNRIHTSDAYTLGLTIASETGIIKGLLNEKTPEPISKHENVQELLNSMQDFVETQKKENEPCFLENYIENVSLLTDADNENPEDNNKVTLMTVHSSKGLEFKNVFIVGLEEDLFPSRMNIGSAQEIEEERRLLYVALTRAEKKATISYSNTRYKWGSVIDCHPSRFIKEINPDFLELPETKEIFAEEKSFDIEEPINSKLHFKKKKAIPTTNHQYNNIVHGNQNLKRVSKSILSQNTNSNNDTADDPQKIQTGMLVEHKLFGKGKVINLEGTFPNAKATVFFPKIGQKQLLLKFAKLKIIK